ncbi:MAG TPA: CDP-diacylglycerol--glycerol-3-phosphate 3-phosphatidyltransferase, partial [Candidatus Babeliaceae bacterium]|nr:CDP-diacylglycerol--glycerol-3-phosphate 3-phosphatidyltransferase [Candidatus Babeliaceae bacterium]
VTLSFTDFLDGYLARRYNQQTLGGKLLDPLADKFMVACAVISLVYLHKLWFYWGIIIIGRELMVMGLREFALHQGFDVPVAGIGKLKTAFQCLLIAVLLLDLGFTQNIFWILFKKILICIVVALTLFSGYTYYRTFVQKSQA